jgi:hypothetical protein
MDHNTAVAVLINAMQDAERSPDEINREVNTLLEAVSPGEREAVLKEATDAYSRLKAGLPFNFDSPR